MEAEEGLGLDLDGHMLGEDRSALSPEHESRQVLLGGLLRPGGQRSRPQGGWPVEGDWGP